MIEFIYIVMVIIFFSFLFICYQLHDIKSELAYLKVLNKMHKDKLEDYARNKEPKQTRKAKQ